MAVLLVLASGTAVSLAVTDTGSSDAETNAAVQETTTEVVETTEDVGVEETTEDVGVEETTEAVGEETTAAADEGEDAQQASVSISEQESDGEQIVIDSVTMAEGGFVAIHDQTLLDDNDAIGSVVGTSVYLEAGTHENVTITLGRTISDTQSLVAMPHQDTNNNQVYDFVISAGEVDGPYVADGETVLDQATVSVEGAAETEEPAETTEVVDETDVAEETATEAPEETDVVETEAPEETTEEDVVETTEEDVVETQTEVVETEEPAETTEVLTEDPEETTEAVDETTEVVDETTAASEEPAGDQQQFVFKVEQMNIDRWSFVVGDEETPDRTETVSDISVSDERVEINLTEILQQQAEMEGQFTTQDPEQAQEELEENLSGDLETVRFVIENVNVENATLVVTAPADMELPEQPGMGPQMTTEEDDVVVETTEEEDVVETTEEEDVVETTEEDVVETTEEDVVETTEEEDVVVETTEAETEEEDVGETTEEDVVETTEEEDVVEETTTAAPQLDSFNVTSLDAPESASAGDTVTVSAEVTNPNDVEATQEVELRLDGDVVERQSVTIAPEDQQTVTFELDTSNLSSGDYAHGVFSRDFGEIAVLTVDEPAADGAETEVGEETTEQDVVEETTEQDVVETETPDVEATTEADGIETTVVANETTVEG